MPRLTHFFDWWRAGLAACVPAFLGRLWNGERVLLALTPQTDGYSAVLERRGRVERLGQGRAYSLDELGELVASRSRARPGLRLASDRCLLRRAELPAAAAGDLAPIMMLDLERATPFRAGDVAVAHFVDGRGNTSGTVRAVQAIVKRGVLDEECRRLASSGVVATFADCWADGGETRALPVNFMDDAAGGRAASRGSLVPPLAVAAAGLAAVALYMHVARYEAALGAAREQTAALRQKAAATRAALAESDATVSAIHALDAAHRARLPVAVILDEVTRLLPDDAYLSELRVDGQTIDMTGHARAATGLLALFEGSALFEEAKFAAPVRFDANQNRERFSLRVKMRKAAAGGVR